MTSLGYNITYNAESDQGVTRWVICINNEEQGLKWHGCVSRWEACYINTSSRTCSNAVNLYAKLKPMGQAQRQLGWSGAWLPFMSTRCFPCAVMLPPAGPIYYSFSPSFPSARLHYEPETSTGTPAHGRSRNPACGGGAPGCQPLAPMGSRLSGEGWGALR